MPSHRREPPEEGRRGGGRRRARSTPQTRESRRTAAGRVIESYKYLRESCQLLPQTGRLPKYHILRGAADQMRALQFENISLRWTVAAFMAGRDTDTRPQAPRTEGRPEIRVVPNAHGGQSARPQDPGRQEEGERRRDELQIIEVRGNCPWPGTPPHPAQDRSQLPEGGNEIARLREVVARLRGGETHDRQPVARLRGGETHDHQPETTRASAGGGGVGEQEDCMEIRVVWGGTVEKPIPIVPHPTPRMPSSPPFPDRSWIARPVGRKVQVGSSTLQRIIPVSRTPNKCEILRNRLHRPTTLQIPVRTLGETGEPEEDMLPMDLSHKVPAVRETSREDVRTTSPPPLISIERGSTCHLPSSSQIREEELSTHGIAQILKAAVIIERARLADQDPMMGSRDDEEVMNMPIIEDSEKDIGIETVPTGEEVLSPESTEMWIDIPTLVIDLEPPPVTEPGPSTTFSTTLASTTGTSTSKAVIEPGPSTPSTTTPTSTSTSRVVFRVAKWVGSLGGDSANQQEMEGDLNLEVPGDKVDGCVRRATCSTEEVPEVGREDVQAQPGVMDSEEEEIDVGGPETMTGEEIPSLVPVPVLSLGEYVDPAMPDDEEPGPVPVLSLGEGEYVESVDEKAMLKALFEDPPNDSVMIPRWPRHLVSHRGEIEDGEVPSVNPPSPVEVIVGSVWLDVVPNIEIHQAISYGFESENETPTREDTVEELNDEIVSDGEIAMSLEKDSEGDGGDELNDEIISDKELAMSVEKDSEGEGRESVRETSAEDGIGPFKDAYVALRRLKIKKLKNRKKTSRKKKDQKWMCERDRDWRPPRRRKVKVTPKIKLVRTRPISEDEESTEPRGDRQSRLKRVWKGTNFKIQDEIITFYQAVPKKKKREGRKKQKRRRREEEQGRYGGFVIALPGSGRSSVSGRPYRLRDLDSGSWESELGGGRLNGPKRLEVDSKTEEGQEDRQEGDMEGGRIVQGAFGTNPQVVVGKDTEEKSSSKQSPSTGEEIGSREDEGAEKEDAPEKETTTADSAQKRPRAGEDPRGDDRATTEGENVEKTETNQCPGSPTAVTTIRVSNSATSISGVQELLRTWVEDGVQEIECDVRIKSVELPPRRLDPAAPRGKSMR